MNKYMFSIIIPVYNSELYIKKCINSLLNQDYQNFEIILINDGSTDNSLNILNEYSNKYENIKVFDQKNKGVSFARNLGISKVTGNWITFVDSDDYVSKDFLSSANKIINNNPNIDLLLFNMQYKLPDGSLEKKYNITNRIISEKNELLNTIVDLEYGENKYKMNFGNCRCIGSKFYKHNIIDNNNLLFNTDLTTFEDGVFNIKYILQSSLISLNDKTVYYYNYNPNSSTNTINPKQLEQYKIVLSEINKILIDNKINNKSVYYCSLNLYKKLISDYVISYKYKHAINKIKFAYFELEIKKTISIIKYNMLERNNKILFILLKCKFFILIYNLFQIKNFLKKRSKYE